MGRRRSKNDLGKIMVCSGEYVDPMNLQPDDLRLEDIAHALAKQCRFSGHTRTFYSVAEHCVRVSLVLHGQSAEAVELSMWGLLHDASEAYLVDLPRPLKHHSGIGEAYRAAEEIAEQAIAEKFGLPFPIPDEVKAADAVLLATERRDLLPARDDDSAFNWLNEPPLRARIRNPWTPEHAEWEFLRRYRYLDRRRTELAALAEAA